ncbi:hypothetical protein RQ832_14515, partial [Roseomonas sp. DSM 102946]|nr:hypothetical protein [Roseomonas sp. DSM 102946]
MIRLHPRGRLWQRWPDPAHRTAARQPTRAPAMTRTHPHSAHWGAFDAVVEGGRLREARPFARDAAPGALLASIPGAVHARSRIDRP